MFNEIYKAAINKDTTALDEIIAKGVSLTIPLPGAYHMNVATLLAFEGDIAAVELLRKRYHFLVGNIVDGLARAGRFTELEFYKKNYYPSPVFIARGLAIGGFFKELADYRDKVDVNFIAEALAYAGHFKELKKYRKFYGARVSHIVCGLAWGGHVAEVEKYALQFPKDQNVLSQIVEGFAMGGYTKQAIKYNAQADLDLCGVASSIAEAGYIKKAHKVLQRCPTASLSEISFGFSRAGNVSEAKKAYSLCDIQQGLAEGAHVFGLLKEIRENKIEMDSISTGFIINFANEGDEGFIRLLLSLEPNTAKLWLNDVIEGLTSFLLKLPSSNHAKQSLTCVLTKLININEIINNLNLNFSQAYALYNYGHILKSFFLNNTMQNLLTPDNFFNVISHLTELPYFEAVDMFEKAQERVSASLNKGP